MGMRDNRFASMTPAEVKQWERDNAVGLAEYNKRAVTGEALFQALGPIIDDTVANEKAVQRVGKQLDGVGTKVDGIEETITTISETVTETQKRIGDVEASTKASVDALGGTVTKKLDEVEADILLLKRTTDENHLVQGSLMRKAERLSKFLRDATEELLHLRTSTEGLTEDEKRRQPWLTA